MVKALKKQKKQFATKAVRRPRTPDPAPDSDYTDASDDTLKGVRSLSIDSLPSEWAVDSDIESRGSDIEVLDEFIVSKRQQPMSGVITLSDDEE